MSARARPETCLGLAEISSSRWASFMVATYCSSLVMWCDMVERVESSFPSVIFPWGT